MSRITRVFIGVCLLYALSSVIYLHFHLSKYQNDHDRPLLLVPNANGGNANVNANANAENASGNAKEDDRNRGRNSGVFSGSGELFHGQPKPSVKTSLTATALDIMANERIREEELTSTNTSTGTSYIKSLEDEDEDKYNSKYNATLYQQTLDQSLQPLSHDTSCGWLFQPLWAGFCNQYMMFIGTMYLAQDENLRDCFIEESMRWKDTFGTEDYIPHRMLFDVVHWNRQPHLPHFVRYDQTVHRDITVQTQRVQIEGEIYLKGSIVKPNVTGMGTGDVFAVAENPKPIADKQRKMYNRYKQIIRKVISGSKHETTTADATVIRNGDGDGKSTIDLDPDAIHRQIMKGGLRPHPEIQGIIDSFINNKLKVDGRKGSASASLVGDHKKTSKEQRFMVIHLRVEPDMANHNVCKDKKVMNMTDIVSMIYEKYPEPPAHVSSVLIIFNRELMEAVHGTSSQGINRNKEAKKAFADPFIRNLTVHNLNIINGMVQNGLWGGLVTVREAGSSMVKNKIKNDKEGEEEPSSSSSSSSKLRHPYYSHYSNTVGAIVNFFLAIQSEIFIGTEVSTYSTLVVNSRVYRDMKESYFYRPQQGISLAVSGNEVIHNFKC